MATNTYVALQTVTVSGSSTTSISFNSIPSGYTDLIIVSNNGMNQLGSAIRLQCNSDTGSNYSDTFLYGTGSAAGSSRESNQTSIRVIGAYTGPNNVLTDTVTIHIQNYSNATTYKTVLSRGSSGPKEVYAIVGTWRNTSAITSLTLLSYNGTDTIIAGSTFTLYGIAAEGQGYATGGLITSDATYYYHAFTSSGTFTPSRSLTADILVVAGGGGGGANTSGGGGAGGLLAFTSQSLSNGTGYTCTVGGGGAGSVDNAARGVSGSNSQFGALTASVGGGGGGALTSINGLTGGSGGGGNATWASGGGSGGSATSGQGYAGGSGAAYSGGGGGGAGGVGGNASGSFGGTGGAGTNAYSSWLSATSLGVSGYIAGGGGGGIGSGSSGGTATAGGGAGGGALRGASGAANTGGGGGGGGNGTPTDNINGYSGGSGVIIVRYAK